MAAQPATGAAPASANPAAQRPGLPLGALVRSAANLLQDADPIDSPLRCVSVSRTQSIDVQFDPGDPATLHALAQWAEQFGGTLISRSWNGDDGPVTVHRVEFPYDGVEVCAYTVIPAAQAAT
jgi:hypothetical protein